jgi:L-rhamnose mutarotase
MNVAYTKVLAGALGSTLLVGVAATMAETKKVEKLQRYGSVIELRAEKLDEYKKLHAAIWPAVAKQIKDSHLRNYSIYLHKFPDGKYYLFSYFEYVGDDFKADMAKMAEDAETQRWWKATDPCQEPLSNHKPGEWWSAMEEVFHQD